MFCTLAILILRDSLVFSVALRIRNFTTIELHFYHSLCMHSQKRGTEIHCTHQAWHRDSLHLPRAAEIHCIQQSRNTDSLKSSITVQRLTTPTKRDTKTHYIHQLRHRHSLHLPSTTESHCTHQLRHIDSLQSLIAAQRLIAPTKRGTEIHYTH